MPHIVSPSVYLIAQTQLNPLEVERWLKDIGVTTEAMDRILDPWRSFTKTSAQTLTELAGRRCYMSYEVGLNPNVTRIRKDIAKYLTNILEKKDGSVIEHCTYTFAIEGVSRVFTGEFNRHRAGMAISEGSMRYIRYEDIPYWIPKIWQEDKTPIMGTIRTIDHSGWTDWSNCSKEEPSRYEMSAAFKDMELHYNNFCTIWADELNDTNSDAFQIKKELTSAMRRIIGMGVSTGGVWTGNIRALRHICEMRITPWAEEEICLVVAAILRVLMDNEPILFGDFNFSEAGFATPKYSKV